PNKLEPGRDAIVNAVKNNESVVIIGEPGSGKTTQVPQYLLDAGLVAAQGLIAVTQPRKVAATTIAARVAAERSTQVGSEVGYAIRFDDTSSPHTRIKFYTDGMLLREMLNDPQLKKCDVVIVDEAHERTLRTDVLLANLKRIQKTRGSASTSASAEQSNGKRSERRDRRPLKIIVMSASLQAERFSNYLGGAPILYVKGRQHPVKLYFSKEHQDDYLDSALRTFFQIHDEKEQGDVLIFLPGQEDIEGLASTIRLYANQQPPDRLQVLVRPLYAALSVAKQHEAFLKAPPNTRKCVLATNIAETSVTIPGIRFVIDTGLCNEKRYLTANKGPGVERLAVSAISKSSAIQRAGRAGRDGPGKCFRLYTEASYQELEPSPLPEVKRCDLTFAVLQQQSFGYDIEHLDLMDQPALSS
ncbi:putative ATP-dependent RNA helicase dhr2, partial [Serendipita sp. 399]